MLATKRIEMSKHVYTYVYIFKLKEVAVKKKNSVNLCIIILNINWLNQMTCIEVFIIFDCCLNNNLFFLFVCLLCVCFC